MKDVMKELAADLKKIVRGDVLADDATLETYSGDYSIFKVRPEAVVFPKDTADIKKLVYWVIENKKTNKNLSLTGRSAGTDMSGGPLNDSIIVEFAKYVNKIKKISADSAVVEPGVYFRDFEKEIAKKGLFYPPYPASKDLCAIGGIVNNNSGGEKTLKYGKTEKYVEELKVVLSDGEEHEFKRLTGKALSTKLKEKGLEGDIYRKLYALLEKNYDVIQKAKPKVSKNSSGYALWNVWDKKTFDITKLIVGSQGTLGLVTEAKLKLLKIKKYNRLVVIFARSLDPVPELVETLLRFDPESIESYDDRTLGLALRFLPALLRFMKGGLFTLLWSFLPEAWMVLRGGLPKMVLLVEFASDDEAEIQKKVQEVKMAVRQFPVQARAVKDDVEAEKYWTIRRQSFNLLHSHVKGKDAAAFVDDLIVRPEAMSEFLPQVNAILDRYKDKLLYTIAGHPGNGNFHIIPLVDLNDPEVRRIIPRVTEEIYKLVFRYGGSMSAEHNDGLIRTPYLELMYGEKIWKLFEEVKRIFDPQNIFNPGKKVGGSAEYSFGHMKL